MMVRSMFDDPAWKNLPLLRSSTLCSLWDCSYTYARASTIFVECLAQFLTRNLSRSFPQSLRVLVFSQIYNHSR